MRRMLWPALLAILVLAESASAQTPSAAAPATSPSTSIASLLADGFEVKAVNDITDEEQKLIWPTSPASPYVMVTFQKGSSIAVCALAMANWLFLPESSVTKAGICYKR